MDHKPIIHELSRSREVFKSLLSGLSEAEYLWKPSADKWNLLQIICHLYDEEREDFRARVKSVLEDSERPLQPIDPVGWVEARAYLLQDYSATLDKWLEERSASVEWLSSLSAPPWDNVHDHPILGKLSAGAFLCNWLVHDYLHIRQILRLKYLYLQQQTGERLDYAGEW